jgi:uncharacterized membrane protein YtjA (UPF0391 family)
MLKWSFVFFIIAVIAGIFGFTGVATGAMAIAKVLFWIFISLFLLTLILGLIGWNIITNMFRK